MTRGRRGPTSPFDRRHPARRARLSAAALSLTGFLAVGTAIAGTARTTDHHVTAGASRVAVATARPSTTSTSGTSASTASASSTSGAAASVATTVPTTSTTTAAPVSSSHAS